MSDAASADSSCVVASPWDQDDAENCSTTPAPRPTPSKVKFIEEKKSCDDEDDTNMEKEPVPSASPTKVSDFPAPSTPSETHVESAPLVLREYPVLKGQDRPLRRPSRRPRRSNSLPTRSAEPPVESSNAPSPTKSGMLSWTRRLSARGFGLKKAKSAKEQNGSTAAPTPAVPIEEDPVVAIFEARNTQRVRFSLEGGGTRGSVSPSGEVSKHLSSSSASSNRSVKQFMSRFLFGGNNGASTTPNSRSSLKLRQEMQAEVAKTSGGSLVWESAATYPTPMGPEVVHTKPSKSWRRSKKNRVDLKVSFTEDPKVRSKVARILKKAHKAEHVHFRYQYAVQCYVKALDVLKEAKYPNDHPTVVKAVELLNNAHHVLSSYNNSANIVKMGIKYEDAGELVRALKMYTIAYRIRRDNLSRNHPSLAVLLNMLGSVQIKRGELKEAMQVYELVLQDAPVIFSSEHDIEETKPPTANLLARSVTHREMGVIYEKWGDAEQALSSYHKSLECVAEWKEALCGEAGFAAFRDRTSKEFSKNKQAPGDDENQSQFRFSLNDVQLSKSSAGNSGLSRTSNEAQNAMNPSHGTETAGENGEMELFFPGATGGSSSAASVARRNVYEHFFPPQLDQELEIQKPDTATRDSFADMDLALTLHQIAQLHRLQGNYPEALDAYAVALRGMKYALGIHHPNVAAVLGNMGNLQKEMGDMDAAYQTYQEVLGIESYRLGLSHPDVAITLHNIATIEAARGHHDQALTLYRKVLGLQKKLFGEDHLSVSVTAACMGDVYERIGELQNAMEIYEQAVRIKSAAVGRHSLDVARLMHKLGKLAARRKEFHAAESYISRAVLIYRLNKLPDDHEWIVDANRDSADIDGALAMGEGKKFQC